MNFDDDDTRKRKEDRPTSFSERESERPAKRQRVVELPAIDISDRQNLLEGLRQLGSNLALVSSESRIPQGQVSANFNQLQEEINQALEAAFSEAQVIVAQNEERQRAEEGQAMAEADREQNVQLQQRFLQRLQPLTERMSQQLTYGEQAQMFEFILNSINNRINETISNRGPSTTVILIGLANASYSFALELLGLTLSNIYEATPQITTQLISLITASAMVFNYLPEMVRSQYVAIPYLGPLFSLMNNVNPVAVRVQNSAAIVTTVYFLLRNAGIDTTDAIASIGSSARQLVTSCSMEIGRFVCSGTGIVTENATSIINTLAARLRDVLAQRYTENQSSASESSQSSQGSLSSMNSTASMSSRRTVDISETQNSSSTIATIQSVRMLLDTPVSEGGVDINPTNTPGELVEERLNALATEDDSNPIIAAEPEQQESVSSDITGSESQIHWSTWLYGKSSSGGRIRKRSRHYKKTKKHNTKRHRITRKHKKYPKKTTKKIIKKNTKKRKTKKVKK